MAEGKTRAAQGLDFHEDLRRRMADPAFAAEYDEALDRARLGVKIAQLREKRGLSQAELASRIRTTQSVISRYESAGYSSYRMDTLRRLADALDTDLRVDFEPRGHRQEIPTGGE